jgi:hypothetical protein
VGLADISWLLESTRLKTIEIGENPGIFADANANLYFAAALRHMNTTVQEMLGIPSTAGGTTTRDGKDCVCARNKNLNQVTRLLALPLPPPSTARGVEQAAPQ